MSTRPPIPTLHIPRRGPRLTFTAAGYGLLILLWLSMEDTGISTVSALAAGLGALITLLMLTNRWPGRAIRRGSVLLWGSGVGLVAGGLAAPLATGLMLLKTAMHSHSYPDYPLVVMGAVLARLPAWSAAGLLLGLGITLGWVALRRIDPDQ